MFTMGKVTSSDRGTSTKKLNLKRVPRTCIKQATRQFLKEEKKKKKKQLPPIIPWTYSRFMILCLSTEEKEVDATVIKLSQDNTFQFNELFPNPIGMHETSQTSHIYYPVLSRSPLFIRLLADYLRPGIPERVGDYTDFFLKNNWTELVWDLYKAGAFPDMETMCYYPVWFANRIDQFPKQAQAALAQVCFKRLVELLPNVVLKERHETALKHIVDTNLVAQELLDQHKELVDDIRSIRST